jgi:hypothetical protein
MAWNDIPKTRNQKMKHIAQPGWRIAPRFGTRELHEAKRELPMCGTCLLHGRGPFRDFDSHLVIEETFSVFAAHADIMPS